MIITSPEDIAQIVRDVAYDGTTDLSPIRAALDAAEAVKMQALLRATAEVEAAKLPKGRRFLVVYQSCGKTYAARGVIYRAEKRSEREGGVGERTDEPGYGLIVDDAEGPFMSRYESLEEFEDYLRRRKVPHFIKYLD